MSSIGASEKMFGAIEQMQVPGTCAKRQRSAVTRWPHGAGHKRGERDHKVRRMLYATAALAVLGAGAAQAGPADPGAELYAQNKKTCVDFEIEHNGPLSEEKYKWCECWAANVTALRSGSPLYVCDGGHVHALTRPGALPTATVPPRPVTPPITTTQRYGRLLPPVPKATAAQQPEHPYVFVRTGPGIWQKFPANQQTNPTPYPAGTGSETLLADRDGHYTTEARINGVPIPMLVDTGATMVMLSREDARRLGINPRPSDFTIPASTPNGITWTAEVMLSEIRIGKIAVRNVRAAVNPNMAMTNLLGMTFLSRLSIEVSNGRLTLRQ
jgi:aspartyl protease family protein